MGLDVGAEGRPSASVCGFGLGVEREEGVRRAAIREAMSEAKSSDLRVGSGTVEGADGRVRLVSSSS